MIRNLVGVSLAAAAAGLWVVAPASADVPPTQEAAPTATVRVLLDGVPAEEYDTSDPLPLQPDRELRVAVAVTNDGDKPVEVRSVRFDGRVLGITFIDYDTRVDAVAAPGETIEREFTLDLGRVDEQAVGLLPVEVSVLDQDREPIGSVTVVVDARGGLTSAYGLFGLLVAVATVLLLGAATVRLVRGTLPENRWYRAVRFGVPGAGIGLTVAVSLSVLGVLVPRSGSALTIVVACALGGLVVGFLTPQPDAASTRRGVPAATTDGRPADGAADVQAGSAPPPPGRDAPVDAAPVTTEPGHAPANP